MENRFTKFISIGRKTANRDNSASFQLQEAQVVTKTTPDSLSNYTTT